MPNPKVCINGYQHSWVAGFMVVHPEDILTVWEARKDNPHNTPIVCETCGTEFSLAKWTDPYE